MHSAYTEPYADLFEEGADNEAIAERILEARKELNLTQKELAEKAGVSEPTVRKLEKGLHKPSMTTLSKLANALGTSYYYLKYGITSKPETDDTPFPYTTVKNTLIPVIDNDLKQVATTPIIGQLFNGMDILYMGASFYDRLVMLENHQNTEIPKKGANESYIVLKLPDLDISFLSSILKSLDNNTTFIVYDRISHWFYPATFKVKDKSNILVIDEDGTEQANMSLEYLLDSSSDLFIYGQLKLLIRQYP